MQIFIDTSSGEYPLSAGAIRQRHAGTSFPTPFRPPAPYVEVRQVEAPPYDILTQGLREIPPVLDGGEYVQQWEVFDLTENEVVANIAASKDQLIADATVKRWAVMTGGLTLPGGISVGTEIDDQNRITSVVANAALAGLTDADEVDFKAASGWVRISIAEVKAIAGAIGQFVQACYTAERAHHEAIALLSTPAQVNAYEVDEGWPDPVIETETT